MRFIRETKRGYRFDKRIFWLGFIAIVSLVVSAMAMNNFNFGTNFYLECKDDICENPFYNMPECKTKLNILWVIPLYETEDCRKDCTWCDQQLISKGIYGSKPPQFLSYIPYLSILIIALCIILNHLIYNKGKAFDVEIPITNKIIINRDMLGGAANEMDKDNRKD